MKFIYHFISHTINSKNLVLSGKVKMPDSGKQIVLAFLFILLFSFGKTYADTSFNPDNRGHLNISVNAGVDGYNYVSLKVLSYDYDGLDDVMRTVSVYFVEENGAWTKIVTHGSGFDAPNNSFTPVNTENAGYAFGNNSSSSGDLRFISYTWQYPQRLSGKTVTMIVHYEWDFNHNGVDRSGDYSGISLTFPKYEPVVNASSFVPQAGGNVLFSFEKTAASSYVNKVFLYADAARTKLLKQFDLTLGVNNGNSIFAWDNSFTTESNLYATYALSLSGKYYVWNSITTNKSYIKPISLDPSYDNCSKKITLSWKVNNNNGSFSEAGQWLIERKEEGQVNFTEIANSLSGSVKSYIDESCAYDKNYDYRVRFVPAGMDKTRILTEFAANTKVSTKRTELNTLSFKTFTKTSAENPKIILNWNPNWCFNPSIKIQRKNLNTNTITDLTILSRDNNNTNTFTDENLTENVPYQYRLVVYNEGRTNETAWQNTIIKDEVKYKSVTASKGTLADRIQLKWNVERNDLSNSFFIKRQVYEEGKDNYAENIANITTNGKYYSYDDRDISPGILYKYTLGSEFTLQSGKIDTVYYSGDIIGFAQASGTVSGRVTFGSGTSVDSVSVFASNANESESLYRSMSFSGAGGLGQIALTPEKHGCVKDGFTWQAWLLPLDAHADMAIYESLKEFSVWYEGSTLAVYLDQISSFDRQISFDMSDLEPNEYFHATISFDGDATLKLYINGKLVNTATINASDKLLLDKCENTKLRPDTTIAYLGDGFLVKGSYKGNVDDLRLWDHALTDKEVVENYNRYINGNETGLIGYWQFDEGLNRYAFDRSNYKKNYNEHHITFTKAESSKVVPTLEQLSIKGITDKNGNYLIAGIPFNGDGSTYAFTPSKQSHEFEPSQLNRFMTYQTSVHNAVDFKDISSFKVRIKTTYSGTSFPSDSVNVLVDGSYLYKDKKVLCTDATGECVVEVPIGLHTITVERRGHSFVDGDNNTSVTMNFKEPVLSNPIKFYDTTKTILAGRVVGGVVQGAKPLGFGLSKANIGEAEIVIEVPDGDYQLNLTDNLISVPGSIQDTINSEATIEAGAKKITVKTDPKTGEFRLLLPPLKYKVTNVTTRGGLTGTNFTLPEFQIDPNVVLNDTLIDNNKAKLFKYNQKLDFTYRVNKISIDVIDPGMPAGVFGDSVFMYTNLTNNSTVKIPMYNFKDNNPLTPAYDSNNNVVYKYGYPVYQTSHIYKLRIKAYEQYQHPDNLVEMEDFCRVPASNATISIQNDLGRYELPLGSEGNPASGDSEAALKEYTFNEEGIFDYRFKAGFPNLVSPYTLGLKIEVDYKDRKTAWDGNTTFKAIVMGDILTGTDFVTSGPDLISFVLRDPPGSNSYSYMEKGTTISNSYSFNKSYVGSETLMGTVNYGQKISVAYGSLFVLKLDEVEIDNKTGAGVEIEQSAGSGTEFNVSTTTTERIETSSSPDYVGRRGDIYVGTSTNMYFGTSRRLNPVLEGGNYVLKVKDEKVGNLSAETNFRYTYAHITETLLPNLVKLRNDLLETVPSKLSATPNISKPRYVTELKKEDENFGKEGTYRFIEPSAKTEKQYENEILKYNTSIDGWISQLALKEDEKIDAMSSKDESVYNKTNISADAGVTTEKSVTICGSSTKTKSSSYSAQGVFKTENGFAYNNLGFQFEFETKHGAESETVNGDGEEYCTTYGYVLADENAGDYLSVDVYTPVIKTYNPNSDTNIKKEFDTSSGAPIFVTRGGRSSCPYEPQEIVEYSKKNKGKSLGVATLQVEKPDLKVANPYATDIPGGKEATYKITLSNLSESNSAGWYLLTVDEKTNTKGAIVTVDGQTLGNGKLYYIVPDEPMEKVLKLKQSSLDELEYNNISLVLSSTCDEISSVANISAQFVPSCSDVTIEVANQIVNTTTSDVLPIKIKDYNLDYKNFGGILLQYKTINQNDNAWSTIRKFVKDPSILTLDQNSQMINSSSIDYSYSMSGKQDQTYQFRALTVCRFGAEVINNESEIITVIKDMVTPTALGTPSPSNGVLTPESEISITFNEDIQNGLLNSTNFTAEAVMNGYTLKHNTALNFDGVSETYSEQQFNLQSVPVSIEAWIRYSQTNSNATLFSIGEGANQLKLQLTGNTLKAVAGTEEYTGTIAADQNWQYVSLGYNPQSKKLSVTVTGQMNNNLKVIDKTITNTIEPGGRLIIGNAFKGNISQLTLWMTDRDLADMAQDRNTSKSGRESGIIGYWPMDEGTGTLVADKVNSRNLTVKGGWYLERMGKAIEMSANNQNLLIPTATIPVKPLEDYSLEFWFKAGAQTNTTMFSCGKGVGDSDTSDKMSIGFDANGKLTVYSLNNTHVIPAEGIQDNQWHHFALSVLRNGNTNVLIDGALKYQIASGRFGALAADKMSLGARYYKATSTATNYTTDQYFTGSLDEFRIWKGALTAENVRLDMRNQLKGDEKGLIAYYPFEEYTLNNANQLVITNSLKDAVAQTSGSATGNVTFTDNTPAMKEARTKENVYFNWTSTNNKIVFNVLEPLSRIENCVLEFSVDRVLDLNGNRMAEPKKWTVYIDNNRLKWATDAISLKKEVIDPMTFTANIVNNSGKYENFTIDGLPVWLSVNKSSGKINPLEKQELIFTVDAATNIGSYECRVTLTGNNNIQEMLPVALKVTGTKPDWAVNPHDYSSSMSITGQVKIENIYQEDTEDMLAAFIGNRCVGIANPVFNKTYNSYFVYLDVYGLDTDENQPVTFSLWDAGTGRVYPDVNVVGTAITFIPNAIIGRVTESKIFNAVDKIEQQLALKQGWNWFSTNVINTGNSLLNQFKTSIDGSGIQIKGRNNEYITYSSGVWDGTLSTLNQTSMYMVKASADKTVKIVGSMAKPTDESSRITINPKWNWIGYIPQFVAPVKEALSGLTVSEGDQIKGQVGFATYTGGSWNGSLQYLTPGLGYMYYSNNATTQSFLYPGQYLGTTRAPQYAAKEMENTHWVVDVNKYQMSMTVTSVALINMDEVANTDMEVAVFIDNECRGSATLKYVETYNRYMAFLMLWGNASDVNKKMSFKAYKASNKQELVSFDESLTFIPDNIVGNPNNPQKINFAITGLENTNTESLRLYPNPTSDILHIDYDVAGIEQVEIFDNVGRRMGNYVTLNNSTINVAGLLPGIYTIKVKFEGVTHMHKFIRK